MKTNTKEYEISILKKIEDEIMVTMKKMVASQHNEDTNTVMSACTAKLNALKLIKSELIRFNEKNHHTNLEYKMSEDEEIKALLKMAEDHKENIEGYRNAGNSEMADKEKGELDVINEFTPAQPTEEEMADYTNELIDNLIAEKGADYQLSQKDMGALMKGAKMKYPNINGNIVKSVLTTRMS